MNCDNQDCLSMNKEKNLKAKNFISNDFEKVLLLVAVETESYRMWLQDIVVSYVIMLHVHHVC